jgi:serine/threonine protein phosphatase 1
MVGKALITYAIGDVHGHVDKLRKLIERCREHADGRPMRIVLIGDYIDRGPDSKDVIGELNQLQRARPFEVICLRGNHEADMLACARGGDASQWLSNGGMQTLASYGASHPRDIPPTHLDWIAALPLTYDDGRRLFVHAGVNPNLPLNAQSEVDLLLIREPFLSHQEQFDRLIVHGHTPTSSRRPDNRPNRVNIDTGAGYGGPLTAAVFSESNTLPIEFLNVRSTAPS